MTFLWFMSHCKLKEVWFRKTKPIIKNMMANDGFVEALVLWSLNQFRLDLDFILGWIILLLDGLTTIQ